MRPLISKPNTLAPDGDFPYGRIKDKVGSNPGTPVNELVYGDIHQFFERLMALGGQVANGLPESEYTGFQLIDALVGVFGGMRRAVVSIGSWNMDADASKIVDTTVPYTAVRGISFVINNDDEDNVFMNGTTIGALVPELECACTGSDNAGVLRLLFARTASGTFDSSLFDSTSVNRGYVIIDYVLNEV